MWDTEVDVAVVGAGIGGLANAIATVDAGGEVLVADASGADDGYAAPIPRRDRVGVRQSWLLHDTPDADTNEYFTALLDGLHEWPEPADVAAVPRRSARNLSRDEANSRFVEPFVGSRLAPWASQCFTSPYGLLYTSMRDWNTTTMRSSDGESIEVHSVGAIDCSDGVDEGALRRWLTAQSRDRDIEVQRGATLERVVFEEGAVVGVVLATEHGPYAVRTRGGVTFSPREQDPSTDYGDVRVDDERLQVCIVGRTACRFARVELLATKPATVRPTCTGSRRQLREGMHEARQPALEGWRCGKVNGYPPFRQ
jgi:hypothetical protein